MINDWIKDERRVRQVFIGVQCKIIIHYIFRISIPIYYQLYFFFPLLAFLYYSIQWFSSSCICKSALENISHIGHPAEIFCYCHCQNIPVSLLDIWKCQGKIKTLLSNAYDIFLPDSVV